MEAMNSKEVSEDEVEAEEQDSSDDNQQDELGTTSAQESGGEGHVRSTDCQSRGSEKQ